MKLFVVAIVVVFAGCGYSLESVPISEWGGSQLKYEDELSNPVPLAIVHHTVSPECQTDADCLLLVNDLRNYFVANGLSKGDIPYNFLIGGNGKVYEGAGWHNAGAHTFGYNAQSIGVGFLGDFRDLSPTPEALEAAQELLDLGLKNEHLAGDYKLVGARQLNPSESPGSALQKIIESWPHWAEVN